MLKENSEEVLELLDPHNLHPRNNDPVLEENIIKVSVYPIVSLS